MLAGLRVERTSAPGGEKKTKKEKKKERRKKQKSKKHTKAKAGGKAAKSPSNSATSARASEDADEAPAHGAATGGAGTARAAVVGDEGGRQRGHSRSTPAQGEEDFFSSLGTVARPAREQRMKPDPEKMKISGREYNPFLRGEKSEQPRPEASGEIPEHLRVFDGGSAWRRRAERRAREAPAPEGLADAACGGVEPADHGEPAGGCTAWRRRTQQRAREATTTRGRAGADGGGAGATADLVEAARGVEAGRRRFRSMSPSGRARSGSVPRSRSRSAKVARAPVARSAPGAGGDDDEVMRIMQQKYSRESAPATACVQEESAPPAPVGADGDDETEDANTLGAMAMEAMLSGDMSRYAELNQRLERKQAKFATSAATGLDTGARQENVERAPVSLTDAAAQRVKVLEEVDAAGRNRVLLKSVQTTSVRTKGQNKRGTAHAVPGQGKEVCGFYEDDNVSLDDLLRRERVEGVQDYDANVSRHILKQGSKFRMLDEEEDEAYALGWYEHAGKKMDDKKRGEKQMQQEVRDRERVQLNLERCTFCMESKRFGRRDAIISASQHAYLCMDAFNQCVLPGQMFIAPVEHVPAVTDADEAVWREMRNFQKCLVHFFEAEQPPRAVIFAESAVHKVSRDQLLLGAGPHASIVAYPVELGLLSEARAYWKKAFDEAECEFTTQHKRVIATDAKGGVRGTIPKGFPYVHADFSLGGGFAHVVEDASKIPRDFVQHTVAGMCQLTVLDRAYGSRELYRAAAAEIKQRFTQCFDWTQALKG